MQRLALVLDLSEAPTTKRRGAGCRRPDCWSRWDAAISVRLWPAMKRDGWPLEAVRAIRDEIRGRKASFGRVADR